MNKLLFPFFLFLSFGPLNLSLQKRENICKEKFTKMPVFISYMKHLPPDSIQDFMKVYLQTKKIQVVTWEGVMASYQMGIRSEMMNLINSGKMSGMTDAKANEIVKSMNPVSNILAMKIFKDTTISNNFVIDSIEWYVGSMPVKDTNQTHIKFYPEIQNKSNPYTVLKSFSDEVIASKLLK